MKKLIATLSLLLASVTVSNAQIVLQEFGAVVDPNTVFYGNWEVESNVFGSGSPNSQFSQGEGFYTISGSGITNSDAAKIEFYFANALNIGTNNRLSVTAQVLPTNASGSFQILLADTAAKTASASFNSTDFASGSFTTAISDLTMQSGFNPAAIDSFSISGGISGGAALFAFSFDSISAVAVPEPSTYAMLATGLLVVGFTVRRRMVRS